MLDATSAPTELAIWIPLAGPPFTLFATTLTAFAVPIEIAATAPETPLIVASQSKTMEDPPVKVIAVAPTAVLAFTTTDLTITLLTAPNAQVGPLIDAEMFRHSAMTKLLVILSSNVLL